MTTLDEFTDILDSMVESHVREKLINDAHKKAEAVNFIDLANLTEQARVITIKKFISSTHKWSEATVVEKGFKTEIFWCNECNIRCSIFEHIICLSIINKVSDGLPTYITHNQYLQYSCSDIIHYTKISNDRICMDCGLPEIIKTAHCHIIETS